MFRFDFLFCLFLTFFCGGVVANICDVCDCQSVGDEVFAITCDCIATEDLHLTSSMMMEVESTKMVIVRNCPTVSIERNSFAKLSVLDTLGIQNCLRVHLATGAFSRINSLVINNVQNLSFGEMSFMGARGIRTIVINSSNIAEVPPFSFYDIQGLNRFNLYNVTIGVVNRNAINVSADTVGIETSKIEIIEANGIVIKAAKVYVKDSLFKDQDLSSFKINTKFQSRLLNNKFDKIFRLDIISPFAEFSGNIFENFHSSILSSIVLPRMINNTILNADLRNVFQLFNHNDFHDNKVECNCQADLLNATKHSTNYQILKNNFCTTKCNLSVFEFEVELNAKCMKDKVVDANSICTYERSITKMPTSTAPSESIVGILLEPRFLLDNPSHVPTHSGSSKNILNYVILIAFLLLLLS